MTDIAVTSPAQHQARLRVAPTLACGLFGGFALGAAARAWMRLISDTPEFTWSGTIFIVAGFTVFGLVQSTVAIGRRRIERRWVLTCVRAVGFIHAQYRHRPLVSGFIGIANRRAKKNLIAPVMNSRIGRHGDLQSLGQETNATVDFTQALLAVDVIAVFGSVAIPRCPMDRFDHFGPFVIH